MDRSIKEEIQAIKEAVSNAKAEIKAHFAKSIPIAKQEFKALWKDTCNEYKVLWANAKAEVQAKQFQKDINKLAKQAERTIVELKKNPHL
jgi:uncharacterized membrane-anchored protein YhcB (DUF1043 family)